MPQAPEPADGATQVRFAEDASFLIIRRDNIGDLLCTTPMIRALRARFPRAWIGALVNSYNAPVLATNGDLDAVFAYDKLKHLASGESRLKALAARVVTMLSLRRRHLDCAILAAPGFQSSAMRFARMVAPRHVVGYADTGGRVGIHISATAAHGSHETQACFRLLRPLGIEGEPPAMTLAADQTEVVGLGRLQGWEALDTAGPLVGLHISARKPQQRWAVDRFASLARRLHQEHGARFLLFWAPGSQDNPRHPGDDEKMAALVTALDGIPILPIPTERLAQLIAGLSLCERVVCSDGGAMHIAAALGKPIVCFFGNSDAVRWHPWGVPYVLLQKESRDVADITVDEAVEAFRRLG